MLEKTLESPWDCKEIQPVHPKGKESACNAGDPDLNSESGRSPGEGNGNLLQYSCLENLMNRGAWQATVHGVARIGHDLEMNPPHYQNFVLAFELPK